MTEFEYDEHGNVASSHWLMIDSSGDRIQLPLWHTTQ